MGILDTLNRFFKRESDGATVPASRFTVPDYYPGVGLGVGDPLAIAAVYRCVNFLSDSVANLPIKFLRQSGGIYSEDKRSEFHYLLNVEPCAHMSAFDMWQQAVRHILMKGNAYLVPIYSRTSAEIERFVLVDPATVLHNIYTDTYTINDTINGVSGVFHENEIIHLKNYTVDGKTGVSTLSYAANVVSTARTADDETKARFANGGSVRGLVGNGDSNVAFGEYEDDELEKEADDIDTKFRNGARIVSLPGQVAFTPIALSSADMQFLETRKFTILDICRFFGVDPIFVFQDGGGGSNYKSVEMANVAFLSNTLNPLLKKIETELNRKLVSRADCCKLKFEFDRSALYAADLEGKAKYQAALLASGVATVNELRAIENRPPVPNGDTAFISTNLRAVDEPSTPINKAATPTNNNENE